MSIIRLSKHTDKYIILDKTFLEDPSISLKLKGFLAYCLAKPDNWKFYVTQLSATLKEGKDAIYSTIEEGIEAGYIEREQTKGEDGKFISTDYIIHELSIKKETPLRENPEVVIPLVENPQLASINNSKERIACSARAGGINPEENFEDIFYNGRNRSLQKITKSEIYKHFLGKPYSPEQIEATIQRFRDKKETIHDAFKLLDLIIEDIRTTPKKVKEPEFDPSTYKPKKLRVPPV